MTAPRKPSAAPVTFRNDLSGPRGPRELSPPTAHQILLDCFKRQDTIRAELSDAEKEIMRARERPTVQVIVAIDLSDVPKRATPAGREAARRG